MRIVVASGGFDPLHSGHLSYLSAAKLLGDFLWVGVNSDSWLMRKKGYVFLPLAERLAVVKELKCVDYATTFLDDNQGSASNLLIDLKNQFPLAEIIFANGGDRNVGNSPEQIIPDITFKFGVGGTDKINSSSTIIENIRKHI